MDERRHRVVHRACARRRSARGTDRRRPATPPAPLSAVMPLRRQPGPRGAAEAAGRRQAARRRARCRRSPRRAAHRPARVRRWPSARRGAVRLPPRRPARAACAASAKPGSGVLGRWRRPVQRRRRNGAEQARQRSRTPPPPGRAGWRRAHARRQRRIRAVVDAEHRPAGRPGRPCRPRSVVPTGAASVSAVTAVSTASAKAGASKPLPGSWNEARFSTKPGAPSARPCQIDARRRAVPQQQHPVQPLGQRQSRARPAAPVRRSDGSRHRRRRPASTGPSPGARAASAAAAASSQAAGRVTSRGGASGSAPAITRRIRTPCQVRCRLHGRHARRAAATRKAYFAVVPLVGPQNPVDDPMGGPDSASFVYRAA